ncbi:hypothetical protein JOB18_020130 [Solea senegalensis]|uniref:Uncharacterized protein n=1 Tax=Solea senegalensis TaxID=28829 RepID=A0AAV6SM72_SOLSE|nr:hypothetical protein JOB18_020130 [Solea senegalensis]
MSTVVARSNDWFRIWNKLRNHLLFCTSHSSFSQTPRHLRPASSQSDVTSRLGRCSQNHCSHPVERTVLERLTQSLKGVKCIV